MSNKLLWSKNKLQQGLVMVHYLTIIYYIRIIVTIITIIIIIIIMIIIITIMIITLELSLVSKKVLDDRPQVNRAA